MSSLAATASTSLRRWSLAALLTNVLIVVTGGAVRVTASGLGCPQWPACDQGSVVPPPGGEAGWHQYVEFGNRLLSFVVLTAVVGAYLAARRELPEGHTVRRLGAVLVVGVLAQAVLGGITVRLELHWASVMAHFLLSMVLIAVATVLHHRVTRPATSTAAPMAGDTVGGTPAVDAAGRAAAARTVASARAVPVLAAAVLVLGTVVTATGPHAGDPGTARFGVSIQAAARTHSLTVWLTVALTVFVLLRARQAGAARLARGAGVLLALEVVQGAVGYWQYHTGVPAELVLVHMLLATLFWIAAVRVALLAGDRVLEPQPVA